MLSTREVRGARFDVMFAVVRGKQEPRKMKAMDAGRSEDCADRVGKSVTLGAPPPRLESPRHSTWPGMEFQWGSSLVIDASALRGAV